MKHCNFPTHSQFNVINKAIHPMMIGGLLTILTACGGGGGENNTPLPLCNSGNTGCAAPGSQSSYTVTPSVSGSSASGKINPSTAYTVNSGATTSLTLTPSTGYSIGSVGGTCNGKLNGAVYTTNAVKGNCTVIANFTQTTPVVTGTGLAACFSVSKAVTFSVKDDNRISNYATSTIGPDTLNGQSVYSHTLTSGSPIDTGIANLKSISGFITNYFTISNGYLNRAGTYSFIISNNDYSSIKSTLTPITSSPVSLNFQPGQKLNYSYQVKIQTVNYPAQSTAPTTPPKTGITTNDSGTFSGTTTFVGIETLTLAGKIFNNVCHLSDKSDAGSTTDSWYAPGYYMIKQTTTSTGSDVKTWQYNG